MTDEELLAAARAGRADAYDAFAAKYASRLMAFGLRMCGHREDAEDVVQDTLLTAYRGLDRVREAGALRTWLYRVAANRCLMTRRKEPPGRSLSFDEIGPRDCDDCLPLSLADPARLPDDEAGRAELRAALERALGTLPKEQRIVVLLRDVEGLSTKESAAALGIGASAVKMRLQRGRAALRHALDAA